ncbi:hypothetical protein LCGC14_2876550, partial [marine sediment metagenome]
MRLDKFTIKAQEAVQETESLAHRYKHANLEPEHLLLALLGQEDGVIPPLLDGLGVPRAALQTKLERTLSSKPTVYGETSQRTLSPNLNNLLHQAEAEALQLKDEYVSTEHLLLALFDLKDGAGRILNSHGVGKEAILKSLSFIRGSQRVTDQTPEEKYQALERYGTDLVELARAGKLDPVIGRDEEIRRCM